MAPGAGILMKAMGLGGIESARRGRADSMSYNRPKPIWCTEDGDYYAMPQHSRHKKFRNTPFMTKEEIALLNSGYLDNRRRHSEGLSGTYISQLFDYDREQWPRFGFTSPYKDDHGRGAKYRRDFNLWFFHHPRKREVKKRMEKDYSRGLGWPWDHVRGSNTQTSHRHRRSIDFRDRRYQPPYPSEYKYGPSKGLTRRARNGHQQSHNPIIFPDSRFGNLHPPTGSRGHKTRHGLDPHSGRKGHPQFPILQDPRTGGPTIFIPHNHHQGHHRHPNNIHDYENDGEYEDESDSDDDSDDSDDDDHSYSTAQSYVRIRDPSSPFVVSGFSPVDGRPLGHHHHHHHSRRHGRRHNKSFTHDSDEDDDSDNVLGRRGRMGHRHGARFGPGGGGDLDYVLSGDEDGGYEI